MLLDTVHSSESSENRYYFAIHVNTSVKKRCVHWFRDFQPYHRPYILM